MLKVKREKLFLLCLISLGAFGRLLFLGKNDLWYDEAATFAISRAHDSLKVGLFYFKLLGKWIGLFGSSEFALRLPSALFSVAALWSAYLLFKKMFSARIAGLTLFLMAFSPFQLWYAQEARNYTMTLFLGLASSFFLYSFLKEEKKRDLVCYLLFSALGLYSGGISLVLFCVQYAFILFFGKKSPAKTLFLALPLLLFIPRLPFFLKRLSIIQAGFWIPPPNPSSLLITLENFILGYNGTTLLYRLSDLLIVFSLGTLLVSLARKSVFEKELAFCILLSFIPLLGVHIVSCLYLPVYLDRLFLVFTPYYYALLAWAIAQVRRRAMRTSILACLAFSLFAADARYFSNQMYRPNDPAHHMGAFVKKPFKPLASFLKEEVQDGDHIFFGYSAPVYPLLYYFSRSDQKTLSSYSFVFDPRAIDTNSRRPFCQIDKNNFYITADFCIPEDEALRRVREKGGRVFFLGGTFQRDGGLDENSRMVMGFFDKNLELIGECDFEGIKLYIYKKPTGGTL